MLLNHLVTVSGIAVKYAVHVRHWTNPHLYIYIIQLWLRSHFCAGAFKVGLNSNLT